MSVLTPDLIVLEAPETSRTYKLSTDTIQGYTDNIEALQQAIYKILNTEKYEFPIYSFSYGIEMEDLIGKDRAYVKAELKRRITECFEQDDRIISVDNFVYSMSGDQMLCTFEVTSIYGSLIINREVSI